ncbi:GntR family transcriptional regulator [Sphingosinicella rhizophila]|uniref:GntR family transcriptional regulator n=1 Tax=Sphingosinicella rhizophila TaxID=3050082 RepID=A0ABU3QAH9_9SPHN|nr:GntR family transcriptional regulator [Sphingosinicella sp. GR2756]MDT9599950.1 GntR family transcriptional regulator [Sphingosinicella sp. GR2756]
MTDIPVAQKIRTMILDGTLSPGTRVAEAAIAERLGVSRTPVRNVIPLLAAEGLLEPVGRRGYAVRRFSVEDSFRATEIRCVLEGYAAREICVRGPGKEVMAQLRDCLSEGDQIFAKGYLVEEDEVAYARMNHRFHDIIVSAADDGLLFELIQRVYAVPFVAPGVVAFNRMAPAEIFPILNSGQHQHHAIVDAIGARQADLAEMLMRGHSGPARRSLGLDKDGETESPT